MTAASLSALSAARQAGILQQLLNDTAAAQNYALESKTIRAYKIIRGLNDLLEEEEETENGARALFAAWIDWLSDWDNYSRNLLYRRKLIGILNKGMGEGKFSLEIYPYASRLYTIGPENGITAIRLHEGLGYMTESESQKFASLIAAGKFAAVRTQLRTYMDSHPECRRLIDHFRECGGRRTPRDNTKGSYYDLEEVFQKCSQRHFQGRMPRPKIMHWSARVNHRTMGSYNPKDDSLMVNRGLDRRDVPSYVLDFIMYHELLHKALGIKVSGGRRMAHTAKFRELEQAHPDYERAEAFLKKFLTRL